MFTEEVKDIDDDLLIVEEKGTRPPGHHRLYVKTKRINKEKISNNQRGKTPKANKGSTENSLSRNEPSTKSRKPTLKKNLKARTSERTSEEAILDIKPSNSFILPSEIDIQALKREFCDFLQQGLPQLKLNDSMAPTLNFIRELLQNDEYTKEKKPQLVKALLAVEIEEKDAMKYPFTDLCTELSKNLASSLPSFDWLNILKPDQGDQLPYTSIVESDLADMPPQQSENQSSASAKRVDAIQTIVQEMAKPKDYGQGLKLKHDQNVSLSLWIWELKPNQKYLPTHVNQILAQIRKSRSIFVKLLGTFEKLFSLVDKGLNHKPTKNLQNNNQQQEQLIHSIRKLVNQYNLERVEFLSSQISNKTLLEAQQNWLQRLLDEQAKQEKQREIKKVQVPAQVTDDSASLQQCQNSQIAKVAQGKSQTAQKQLQDFFGVKQNLSVQGSNTKVDPQNQDFSDLRAKKPIISYSNIIFDQKQPTYNDILNELAQIIQPTIQPPRSDGYHIQISQSNFPVRIGKRSGPQNVSGRQPLLYDPDINYDMDSYDELQLMNTENLDDDELESETETSQNTGPMSEIVPDDYYSQDEFPSDEQQQTGLNFQWFDYVQSAHKKHNGKPYLLEGVSGSQELLPYQPYFMRNTPILIESHQNEVFADQQETQNIVRFVHGSYETIGQLQKLVNAQFTLSSKAAFKRFLDTYTKREKRGSSIKERIYVNPSILTDNDLLNDETELLRQKEETFINQQKDLSQKLSQANLEVLNSGPEKQNLMPSASQETTLEMFLKVKPVTAIGSGSHRAINKVIKVNTSVPNDKKAKVSPGCSQMLVEKVKGDLVNDTQLNSDDKRTPNLSRLNKQD